MKIVARLLGFLGLISIILAAVQTATEPFTDFPAFNTPSKALIAEFSFFTIWSNIIGTIYLLRGGRVPRWFAVDAVAMLTITGIVYNTLLSKELHGLWQFTSPVQHTVMPIAVFAFWLLNAYRRPIFKVRTIIMALGIPVVWSILTFTRGAQTGWYPYFFIDVTNLGLGTALRNAIGVYIGFFILCSILALIERIIRLIKRGTKYAAAAAVMS
ncbi:hypothetical protein FRC0522_01880 [Corynebacterium diphtheriae]|nr:hypothetical protein FRC0522_01880 [Corynebacterium diphtheriae]